MGEAGVMLPRCGDDAAKPSWKKGIKRSKIQEEFVFFQGIGPSKHNFQRVLPCLGAMVWRRGMGGYCSLPKAVHNTRSGEAFYSTRLTQNSQEKGNVEVDPSKARSSGS